MMRQDKLELRSGKYYKADSPTSTLYIKMIDGNTGTCDYHIHDPYNDFPNKMDTNVNIADIPGLLNYDLLGIELIDNIKYLSELSKYHSRLANKYARMCEITLEDLELTKYYRIKCSDTRLFIVEVVMDDDDEWIANYVIVDSLNHPDDMIKFHRYGRIHKSIHVEDIKEIIELDYNKYYHKYLISELNILRSKGYKFDDSEQVVIDNLLNDNI